MWVVLAAVCAALPSWGADPSECEQPEPVSENDAFAARMAQILEPVELDFVTSASSHHTRAVEVAAKELLWDRVAKSDSADLRMRAVAVEELIDAYLRVGLVDDAIELYDSLGDEAKDQVTLGQDINGYDDTSELTIDSSNLTVHAGPRLTAANLAIALSERGQKDRARILLKRAETNRGEKPERYDGGLWRLSSLAAGCARPLIEASSDTDWFVWRYGRNGSNGCSSILDGRLSEVLAARALEQSGLPNRWRLGVSPNDEKDVTNGSQPKIDAALKKLPGTQARIEELKTNLAELDQRDQRWIDIRNRLYRHTIYDTPETARPPSGADHELAQLTTARLARKQFDPYHVDQGKPSNAASPEPWENFDARCGRQVLRCIELDGIRWDLIASQDYDPSGEVPAAGYWLRRTEAATGKQRAFYLGLKEHDPFELMPSTDPLIIGDTLQLSVRLAKIDPTKIMFPPMALSMQRDGKLRKLQASLADIMHDSDNDGLTDLAEQQLLLDPDNADSDGDGLKDSEDVLPNVARKQTVTPRQAAMRAALAFLTHASDGASTFGVAASDTLVRRQSTDERTLFINAEPDDITDIPGQSRVIVIPNSLDAALLKKHQAFALVFPMSVSITMLDDAHAEVIFNADWRGGTFALELRDGVWRIGVLNDWIT